MTRQERIHHLFNELHEALGWEYEDSKRGYMVSDREEALDKITKAIDAAHHDYTNIVIAEVTD